MFYSSRRGTRKQTSFVSKTTKHEDGNKSGNETDGGSAELLDISTSREDLSPSRCSCQSGGSNVAVKNETASGEQFWGGNIRLEFDNNGGSDDEQLKDELLRIFDRERLGLESYFKQKTENILAGYRRKQYDWEEKVRLERMEYEKTLAQEKTEVQQSYITEMTNLTKQFNQERIELESHYKKQIQELSQQFELRKKEMDATILKERTELKERLELEYQAMLKSQKAAEEHRYHLQISEMEESYKKKIVELEQKLKDSFSQGELSGRRLQSDLEAKFEREKSVVIVEWRKRVEMLEVELGKEKVRAREEERKACESVAVLKNEISKKDVELQKLHQVVETLKLELSHKEKTAKDHEILQQNIFLRGIDALPGKLREDFDKMLAAHREELARNLRKEREGLETEREARFVLEREMMEKQLKVERERLNLDLEKERSEMRHASREKEDQVRQEVREEMQRMRDVLESEKVLLREQVAKEKDEVAREKEILTKRIRTEMMKEKQEMTLKEKELLREQILTEMMNDSQLRVTESKDNQHSKFDSLEQQRNKGLMKEKVLRDKLPGKSEEEFEADFEGIKSQQGRDQVMVRRGDQGLGKNHLRFEEAERGRNDLGRNEYEVWLAGQRMQHTKQWVEGQYRFTSDTQGYVGDSVGDVQGKNSLDRFGGDGGKNRSDSEEDKQYMDGIKDKRGLRNDNHEYGEECDRNDVDNVNRLRRQGGDAGPLTSKEDPRNHKIISTLKQNFLSSEPDRPTDTSVNPGKPDECSVQCLKEENEGLKAKVGALQENIELHECFKKEASEEVQRLRNSNKDLKMKVEGLKEKLNDYEELKGTLQDCDKKLKDYEVQMKDNEETLKEYEDICAEYERTLHKCRQRISEIENDQASLPVFRKPKDGWNKPEDGRKKLENIRNKPEDGQNKPKDGRNNPEDGRNKPEDGRNKPEDGRNKPKDGRNKPEDGRNKPEDGRNKPEDGRNKPEDGWNRPVDRPDKLADSRDKLADSRDKLAHSRNKSDDSRNKLAEKPNNLAESRKDPKNGYKDLKEARYQETIDYNSDNNGYVWLQNKPRNEMIVNILENERARLEQVVKNLEEKIKLLEIKISETTLHKANVDSTGKLSLDLKRVRTQNKCLVKKLKGFQCQFQALIEKLRKKKKKIANLKDKNQYLKSCHQREISDFQRKLEHSSQVITRLQQESSRESSHVCRLKEEILNISKMMKEERVNEQRMIRARSIEEIRDLDRDKVHLERKFNDVKTALDGYSDRLKTKMSYSQTTGSQLSLNADTTLVRDVQLSCTLKALEDTQQTSRHQNERLEHEKHELQTLMSKLCKSQEELRNNDGYRTFCKESLSSHSSSMSSLSSLLNPGKTEAESATFSRTFSIFE